MNYHIDADGSVTWLEAGADPVEITGQEAADVKAECCRAHRAAGCWLPWDDGRELTAAAVDLDKVHGRNPAAVPAPPAPEPAPAPPPPPPPTG